MFVMSQKGRYSTKAWTS